MALHDMTSGDFTHDTQNTYTHNKHRVRMRPPKGVWQVTWQVSDNLGVSCDDPIKFRIELFDHLKNVGSNENFFAWISYYHCAA